MGNTPTEMPSAPPPHTTCTYIQYNMLHTSIFPDDILWGEPKAVGVSRAGGRRGMVHISRCERGGFQQSLYFGLCTRVAEIHNENYLKATSFFFQLQVHIEAREWINKKKKAQRNAYTTLLSSIPHWYMDRQHTPFSRPLFHLSR